MRCVIKFGTAALLPLALAGVANAQDALVDDELPEEPTRYHVEVILFVNEELDPTEELFDYQPHKQQMARSFPPVVPTKRATPVVVWSFPDDAADGGLRTEPGAPPNTAPLPAPPPRSTGFGDSIFAVPQAPPENRPRIVLEGLVERAPGASRGFALETGPEQAGGAPGEFAVLPVDQLPVLPVDQLPAIGEPVGRYLEDLDSEIRYLREGDSIERRLRYRRLRRDELQLTDAYARLDNLDAYRPLLHAGWVQEGLAEEEAVPFDLRYLGMANPTGTIQLHVIRFLHLTLDLDYRYMPRAALVPETEAFGLPAQPRAFGEPRFFGRAALEEVTLPPRYFIDEHRRTRSGELSYFDHPAFGVLVLVTPAPELPEDTEVDAEDGSPAA